MNKSCNKTSNHFKHIKSNNQHYLNSRNRTGCWRWNRRSFNFNSLCKSKPTKTKTVFRTLVKIKVRNRMSWCWMKRMGLFNRVNLRRRVRLKSSRMDQFKSRKRKLSNRMDSSKFRKFISNNSKINRLQMITKCLLINKTQLML